MTPVKLACPKCQRTVPEAYWQGVDLIRCPGCNSEFEQISFPAQQARQRLDRAAGLIEGDAHCFFHVQNRAETACDGCGRYVCAVCRVAFAGKQLCPSCLEARDERRKLPENHRVLYESIALALAVVPLLIWPLTLLTAPAALAFCFYGWSKPGSIVPRRRRLSFIVAGTIASLEIGGWLVLGGRLLLR